MKLSLTLLAVLVQSIALHAAPVENDDLKIVQPCWGCGGMSGPAIVADKSDKKIPKDDPNRVLATFYTDTSRKGRSFKAVGHFKCHTLSGGDQNAISSVAFDSHTEFCGLYSVPDCQGPGLGVLTTGSWDLSKEKGGNFNDKVVSFRCTREPLYLKGGVRKWGSGKIVVNKG
ncbi:hypothetical protein HGRIS_005059 [Hohenbuehelia grisea]|uniref:Uncharacterized protein n=1 Tax=Hohenbuehelia grisea TaxID=104357 RepID=A0ABR3JEB2_9AGAR